MPKRRAKNMTARMSLLPAAPMMLVGTILSSASSPVGASREVETIAFAPSPALASIVRANSGSMPSPGRSRLTSVSARSEEYTSELQSLMRISYAVFCLKKHKHHVHIHNDHRH